MNLLLNNRRRLSLLSLAIAMVLPAIGRAEYYSFDVPSGANIITQEVRWPFWAESTYNAVWTNDLVSADKSRGLFLRRVCPRRIPKTLRKIPRTSSGVSGPCRIR